MTVYYGGEANVALMNRLGFDVMTPGNGDFYWGVENLLRLQAQARFGLVHANTRLKRHAVELLPPYVVKDANGIRVGILGVGTVHRDHPAADDLLIADPVRVVRHYLPRIRAEADMVIVLSHLGYEADCKLAEEVSGIDLVVGGHSHTKLEAPTRVPATAGGEVFVAQAGDEERYLGRIDLDVERTGQACRLTRVEGCLIPVNSETPEDPEIAALLKQFASPLDETLCTAEVALQNPEKGPSPMGALVAEVMRAAAGADAALLDRGGVCAGIEPGPVTRATVCRIHPWRNEVFLVRMTGAQLQKTVQLDDVLHAGCSPPDMAAGQRAFRVAGKPVAENGLYVVAVGSYLYGTTPALRKLPAERTGLLIYNLLEDYLTSAGVLSSGSLAGVAPLQESRRWWAPVTRLPGTVGACGKRAQGLEDGIEIFRGRRRKGHRFAGGGMFEAQPLGVERLPL